VFGIAIQFVVLQVAPKPAYSGLFAKNDFKFLFVKDKMIMPLKAVIFVFDIFECKELVIGTDITLNLRPVFKS